MAIAGVGHPERSEQPDWGLREVEYVESSLYVRYIKRPLDLFGSLILLSLMLPLLAFVAALVQLRLGSPVIFTQDRVGRHGRHFTMYKFRTMIPDRREEARPFDGPDRRRVHKSPGDPRVGPLGNVLRMLSLDELPQLWNVIKGDMSLVGPRPELPEIVDQYEKWQHARHSVKPGITCLWQISGRDHLLKDSTELDIRYIESVSLVTDLKILFATPIAVFGHKRGF